MTASGSVQVVEGIGREEFDRRFVQTGTPVIVRGLVSQWPALRHWCDLEYLRRRIGSRRVRVTHSPDGDFMRKERLQVQEMEVSRFLDLVGEERPAPERWYMHDVFLRNVPELLGDVVDPPFFDNSKEHYFDRWSERFGGNRLLYRVMFLGRDTFTPTHHHVYNQALLCQVLGRKRMKLYAPPQSRALHARWLTPESPVHPYRPDLARFSRFADAKGLDCEVEPGDMLFIPVHWWHFVDSPGLSLAVTMTYSVDFKLWHFPDPGLLSLVFAGAQGVRQLLGDRRLVKRD